MSIIRTVDLKPLKQCNKHEGLESLNYKYNMSFNMSDIIIGNIKDLNFEAGT